jgi:nicotinate-nucleotide pyrophosphorylase (carboxylating)
VNAAPDLSPEDWQAVRDDTRRALDEDFGSGDLTAVLVPDTPATAHVLCREPAVIAGGPWFGEVFRQAATRHGWPADAVTADWTADDGQAVAANTVICRLHGPARALLSGERCALNFLQTLSGTATQVRAWAKRLEGLPARLLDTRKTLPGLRRAQKYAVRRGGGHNHRMGLFDAVLIKENHIAAAGSIAAAVVHARALAATAWVEVEVENLGELDLALAAAPDRILLDNFDLDTLRQAVRLTAGRVPLEASGGITEQNLRAVAETGVDYLSSGALTKDVRAVDLSLRFDAPPGAPQR